MSESSVRAPRQGWAELPPPDPEIRIDPARSMLMSPSSGESSASPIEIFERNETGSPKSFSVGHSAGHFSQQARQRIRERTKSMVEKQRIMAKKLAKNQRNESIEGEYAVPTVGEGHQQQQPEEIAQGDRQIEQSIQIGAKYVEDQLRWDDQQQIGKDAQNVEEGNRPLPLLLLMAPPRPYSQNKADKFRQMIVWKGANPTLPMRHTDLEGGNGIVQRGNNEKLTKGKFIEKQLFNNQTNFPPNIHHQNLVVWRPPLAWNEWLKQSGSRRWASQKPTSLWLDLQCIEFDHHWLFTRAEAAQRELLGAYDAWAIVHQKMLEVVKEWLAMRQKMGDSEHKSEDENEELDALFGQCLQRNAELERCRAALQMAWAETDQTRGRFQLERLEGHAEVFEEESEGGVPDQLKAFFHSPMFMLSERETQVKDGQHQQISLLSELERQRRAAVENCRYQAQIFFNELLVASSDECSLEWPSFSVQFGQIFPLRVFERPEQLRLALREKFGRGNWQPIADIFVPLPEEVEGENVEQKEAKRIWASPKTGLQFASMVLRGSYKSSLGCGQRGLPFMQGRLFCALRWQYQNDGPTGAEGIVGQKHLAGRRAKRNEWSQSPPSLFPAQTLLYPEETLQNDQRLLALEKRWKMWRGKRDGIGIEMANEIGEEGKSDGGPNFGKHRGEMELEMRRRLGREFAAELRRSLRESGEHQRRAQDLSELIREEPLPLFGVGLLSAIFAQRQIDVSRRLKPIRNPKATQIGRSMNESARLILNIQHASGVPQRANGEVAQLFLLCTLQGQSQSTALVDGRHANWQETLVLDIPPPPFNEELYIEMEIFDREVRPLESDDREKDTRHERVEKRWLGSARVPLSALNGMAKMDGHLALRGPIFYTGYKGIPSKSPITVRILISRDPPSFIHPSATILNNSPFGESDQNLIAECLKFESSLQQRFPNRRILSMATDSSGKRVLALRFLRRLPPPPQIVSLFNVQPKNAVELAAQMVASIPTFHDPMVASSPIWSTADETLRIACASPDEQGILLCCWLLGLQLSSVLLLGKAMPDGPNCAFVLVQFGGDQEHWLISPGDGHHFAPSDPNCPLISVGTVLTMDNVFANVQNGEHPSQLDFDLRKRAHWESLFGEGRKNLVSVQPEFLRYEPVDENALMELRTGLEREIRLKFDEARPFAIPQWNLMASRTLREILADSWRDLFSPESTQNSTSLENNPIDARLAHLRPAFQISALAFRLPFISRHQIIGHCMRTLVHTNSQPMAQFALAVHLQPFFGTIFSCSIAICTLLPNTSTTGRGGRSSRGS